MEPKIEYKKNAKGLLWPYYQGQKAWSPSSLVEILKKIEYADKQIPERVLLIAAKNGTLFHQIIQEFFQTGLDLSRLVSSEINPKMLNKLQKTICFLEKNKQLLSRNCFVDSERLHYTFYEGILVATYVDLEFNDFVVELKTNNIKMHESPLTLLSFQIQLLIQYLCTKKKDIYLLWSTEDRVIFHKFQISDKLLKVLDILIDLVKKTDQYTLLEKRKIVEKILNDYSPSRLF